MVSDELSDELSDDASGETKRSAAASEEMGEETLDEGRVVGGFRLGRLLGRGGMSRVYEAQRVKDGMPAAVKLLAAGMAAQATTRQRFRREAEAIRALDHPHIVPLLDYGNDQGTPYLALKRIDGRTFSEIADDLEELPDTAVTASLESRSPSSPAPIPSAQGDDTSHGEVRSSDSEERYRDWAEMAADLRRFVSGQETIARRPNVADRTIRWVFANPKTSLGVVGGVAACVLLAIGIQYGVTRRLSTINQRLESTNETLAATNRDLDRSRTELQRHLYVADLAAAYQAYGQRDLDAVHQLLGRHVVEEEHGVDGSPQTDGSPLTLSLG